MWLRQADTRIVEVHGDIRQIPKAKARLGSYSLDGSCEIFSKLTNYAHIQFFAGVASIFHQEIAERIICASGQRCALGTRRVKIIEQVDVSIFLGYLQLGK